MVVGHVGRLLSSSPQRSGKPAKRRQGGYLQRYVVGEKRTDHQATASTTYGVQVSFAFYLNQLNPGMYVVGSLYC